MPPIKGCCLTPASPKSRVEKKFPSIAPDSILECRTKQTGISGFWKGKHAHVVSLVDVVECGRVTGRTRTDCLHDEKATEQPSDGHQFQKKKEKKSYLQQSLVKFARIRMRKCRSTVRKWKWETRCDATRSASSLKALRVSSDGLQRQVVCHLNSDILIPNKKTDA